MAFRQKSLENFVGCSHFARMRLSHTESSETLCWWEKVRVRSVMDQIATVLFIMSEVPRHVSSIVKGCVGRSVWGVGCRLQIVRSEVWRLECRA